MVLPAPLGPMMPNRAPAATRSDTSATAVTPRNRRRRRSASSAGRPGPAVMPPPARRGPPRGPGRASSRAMSASRRRPAARTRPQSPPGLNSTTAISVSPMSVCHRVQVDAQFLLEQHDHHRPQRRPPDAAEAAEHDHDDQQPVLAERHRRRADQLVDEDVQDARHAGEEDRDHPGEVAVQAGPVAERGHPGLVGPHAPQRQPERGVHDGHQQQRDDGEHDQNGHPQREGIVEVERADARQDGQRYPVVALAQARPTGRRAPTAPGPSPA